MPDTGDEYSINHVTGRPDEIYRLPIRLAGRWFWVPVMGRLFILAVGSYPFIFPM